MKDKIARLFEEKFARIHSRKLSEFVYVARILKDAGITWEQLEQYLDDERTALSKQLGERAREYDRLLEKYLVCPDCGARMQYSEHLYGEIKTRFSCTNCDLALDSDKPISVWLKEFQTDAKKSAKKKKD